MKAGNLLFILSGDQVLTLSLRAAPEASRARSERIGVTRGHPFWSQDRGGWVRAGELRTGETLLGLHGMQVTVESVGSHPVAATYNFEVESDHAYRVGGFGTLIHNLSPIPNETPPVGSSASNVHAQADADAVNVEVVHQNAPNTSDPRTYTPLDKVPAAEKKAALDDAKASMGNTEQGQHGTVYVRAGSTLERAANENKANLLAERLEAYRREAKRLKEYGSSTNQK